MNLFIVTVTLLCCFAAGAADHIRLKSGDRTLYFSGENGRLLGVARGTGAPAWIQSSSKGLWIAEDENRKTFPGELGDFECRELVKEKKYEFIYTQTRLTVTVGVEAKENGVVDFTARIEPKNGLTVYKFHFPAELTFSPDEIERVIAPDGGLYGGGLSFNSEFFRKRNPESPGGWNRSRGSVEAYRYLYGKNTQFKPEYEKPVRLQVTEAGKQYFPDWLVKQFNETDRTVNRAPGSGEFDEVLVDSPNGPFYSAKHFRNNGALWRVGSYQRYLDTNGTVPRFQVPNIFVEPTVAVLRKRLEAPFKGKRVVALIDLADGPMCGLASHTKVSAWRERLEKTVAEYPKCELLLIRTAEQLKKALDSNAALAIVNPYGEGFPVSDGGYKEMISALRTYLDKGGVWFETAGYPFYWDYTAQKFLRYSQPYNFQVFADFQQLDGKNGEKLGVYSVQPQVDADLWKPAKFYVPTEFTCGGGEQGGWTDRSFNTYVESGSAWECPVVRFRFGEAPENLEQFCRDNKIEKTLAEKVSPELFEKLKLAPMVKFEGFCWYFLANLHYFPTPTLIHYDRHLRYDYDTGYPDHLPTNPARFSTSEEYLEFLKNAKRMGHLTMPYSNSTFWGENPRGETFLREGDVGLRRDRDGKISLEAYGHSDNPKTGYTASLWHPVTQKANRYTIHQFKEEFPSDILFQDQFGARALVYDFNKAAPAPNAYFASFIAQTAEDSKSLPLATEGGFAHILDYEVMLFGMSFGIVPTDRRGSSNTDYRFLYPPDTWSVFPMVQYLAHDKVILRYHNHIAFVSNDKTLSWTLGMGFAINYMPKRWGIFSVAEPKELHFLNYLTAIQRTVIAQGTGEKTHAFEHVRDRKTNDGFIRATYGPVSVSANLDPEPRVLDNQHLAAYGFYAKSPNLRAGIVNKLGAKQFSAPVHFIAEQKNGKQYASFYAKPGEEVGAELVTEEAVAMFRLPDGRVIPMKRDGKYIYFTMPSFPNTPADCTVFVEGELK